MVMDFRGDGKASKTKRNSHIFTFRKGDQTMFENEFEGKVVLVTGGTTGIGYATVKSYLKAGAKVYFLGKEGEDVSAQLEELKSINPNYEFKHKAINLCDYKAAQELYAEIEEMWGKLDILVNNAGVDSSLPIHKMKQAQWDYVMDTNIKSMFNMTKYAIKLLKKTKGCIVNTASVAGIYGSGCGCPYPVSKGGVIAFTQSMAWEQAYAGIRCNAVAPGVINTKLLDTVPPFAKKNLAQGIPLRYIGEPQVIADAILFLSSSAASYITGVTLPVDGGYRPANVAN